MMRTLIHTQGRGLRWYLVILIAGLLNPPLLFGQGSSTIAVHFEIESELYNSQLGDLIPGLEQDLSSETARLLKSRPALSYINWIATDSPSDAHDANDQHHLHLILEEKPSPLGAEIHIRFVTHIAGAPPNDLSNQSLEAFYPTIFRPIDSKFTQDQRRLFREITTWLDQTHFDQAFEDELARHFLRYVPLAFIDPSNADMQIDPVLIIISTPINYNDLYPDSESKLKAIFRSEYSQDSTSSLAGQVLPGHMYLRPIVEANPHLRVSFTCHNDADSLCFSYPGTSLFSESEVPQKFSSIQTILDRDNLVDMQLYMEKYVKNYYPVTAGGIVTTP